ncbi:MAG: carbohydrate kinase [Anaeromyxobacteraceae bacterium]
MGGARDLDVVCLGEALVDFLPDRPGALPDVEAFRPCAGGAPANVATGLARLGRRVAFTGVVGDDPLGRFLARRLADEGVEPVLRFSRERPTGVWFVALEPGGERSFFSPNARFSADKLFAPPDVAPALLARAAWLHVGSSAHVLPAGREALRAAVAAARAAGTRVSFDPNVRAHLWDDLEDCRRLCAAVIPSCDLVKLSEEEAPLCTGEHEPERAAARLVELGVGLACVTLGARGALLRRGDLVVRVPAAPADVVDTTGAGDAWVAGVLASLATAEPLEALGAPALAAAGALGARVAARVVAQPGAVAGLPRIGEISV